MLTVLPYLSDLKVNCSLGNGEYLTISFNDFGEGVWATWLSGAAAIIGEEEMNADIKCKQKKTNFRFNCSLLWRRDPQEKGDIFQSMRC